MHLPLLFGLALSLTPSMDEIAPQSARREIIQEPGVLADAIGVWHSQESGWVLQINEGGIQRWQVTPTGCYASETNGPTFMGSVEYRYFTPTAVDEARFEYLPGDGHADFRRLDALPAGCSFIVDQGPVHVFETFVAIFHRHYAHFERRGVDWEALTQSARAQISADMSDEDLFALLATLLEPLGDSHTKLIAEINGERHRAQFGLGDTLPRIEATLGETPWLVGLIQQLFAEVLDPGAQHTANDRVVVGSINNRVGYLQFLTMGGFSDGQTPGSTEWAQAELSALDALMDDALTQFASMDAVILDLTNNRGGYDAVCRSIASRFTETPFTGYTVRAEDTGPDLSSYSIEPHHGPRFVGPVFVLTSDVTVSCGEITALMLRQLPHVQLVGDTTRGAFSTPLAKPLPNGWYLELSNEIYADGRAETFEGRGIAPDIVIDPFPVHEPIKGHAVLIDRVMDLLYADTD